MSGQLKLEDLPDGRQVGYIWVHSPRDDSSAGQIGIPVGVISRGSGPTVLLLGGAHGDEYIGQAVLSKLFKELGQGQVKGRIIFCPNSNPAAAMAGTRLTPQDGGNLNNAYHKRPAVSLTDRIGSAIEHHLIRNADVVVDLHSGGRGLEYVSSVLVPLSGDHIHDIACLKLANVFAAPYLLIIPSAPVVGNTANAAAALGKAFIATELGGSELVEPEQLTHALVGIENVLKYAGVLEGSKSVGGAKQLLMTPDGDVRAPEDGIFLPVVRPGQFVKSGSMLGSIVACADLLKEEIPLLAPRDGFVVCWRRVARCQRRDLLYGIADSADEYLATNGLIV